MRAVIVAVLAGMLLAIAAPANAGLAPRGGTAPASAPAGYVWLPGYTVCHDPLRAVCSVYPPRLVRVR